MWDGGPVAHCTVQTDSPATDTCAVEQAVAGVLTSSFFLLPSPTATLITAAGFWSHHALGWSLKLLGLLGAALVYGLYLLPAAWGHHLPAAGAQSGDQFQLQKLRFLDNYTYLAQQAQSSSCR